jgi:hypothetical protein
MKTTVPATMQDAAKSTAGADLLLLVRSVRNSLACGASSCARNGSPDSQLLDHCAQHALEAEQILERIRNGLDSVSAEAAAEGMDDDEGADDVACCCCYENWASARKCQASAVLGATADWDRHQSMVGIGLVATFSTPECSSVVEIHAVVMADASRMLLVHAMSFSSCMLSHQSMHALVQQQCRSNACPAKQLRQAWRAAATATRQSHNQDRRMQLMLMHRLQMWRGLRKQLTNWRPLSVQKTGL